MDFKVEILEPHPGTAVYLAWTQDAAPSTAMGKAAAAHALNIATKGAASLCHHPSGAPYLVGDPAWERQYISLSHSRAMGAVCLDTLRPVGIDVEEPRQQLLRVAGRVLSPEELVIYGKSLDSLLRAWTLKEALYKCAGIQGADFRRDIRLPLSDALLYDIATEASPAIQAQVDSVTCNILMCRQVGPANSVLAVACRDD